MIGDDNKPAQRGGVGSGVYSRLPRPASSASGNMNGPTNFQKLLSESVVETATSTRKFDKTSTNLSQLALDSLSLHGRDDQLQILKNKLLDFREGMGDSSGDEPTSDQLLLVTGASG